MSSALMVNVTKPRPGRSNDFGQAVSELAALATAGKDVAALNGVDVRAFTGKAKFCKKFAAGFSNCCKDSGWGPGCGAGTLQQRGKGAGQSEKDKLTVSIGEFCSKKGSGDLPRRKKGAIASSTQNWRRSFSSREEMVSCISVLAAPAVLTVGDYG